MGHSVRIHSRFDTGNRRLGCVEDGDEHHNPEDAGGYLNPNLRISTEFWSLDIGHLNLFRI